MGQIEETIITTSDIYFVAACLVLGGEIKLPVNATDPKHLRFTVTGFNLDKIKEDWVAGNLSGNLIEFSRCIKNLKLMIHDRV
jgi:hypothetical protein